MSITLNTGDIIYYNNTKEQKREYYIVVKENGILYAYYNSGLGLKRKNAIKIFEDYNINNYIIIKLKRKLNIDAFKYFIDHHKHINDNPIRILFSIRGSYDFIKLLYSIIYFLSFKKIWLGYSYVDKKKPLKFIKECYIYSGVNIHYIKNITDLYNHTSFDTYDYLGLALKKNTVNNTDNDNRRSTHKDKKQHKQT